jgi:hypothetical protein
MKINRWDMNGRKILHLILLSGIGSAQELTSRILGDVNPSPKGVLGALTLRENVHWIVHVDTEMVCDPVQLSFCRRNRLSISIFDLVASTILLDAARNRNGIAVRLGLVRLMTSVLESDRDLRRPGHLRYSTSTSRECDTYVSPDMMNDLRPLPRPVEPALPPRARVIAERAALLPPVRS